MRESPTGHVRPIGRRTFGKMLMSLAAGVASPARAETAGDPSPSGASLKQAGSRSGVRFGLCEPGSRLASEGAYFERIAAECGLFSPSNEFNWATVEPQQGRYKYASLDAVAAFCRAHELGLLGHNLSWYYTIPSWAKVAEPADFVVAFNAYVETTMKRYDDVVTRWDVVNEPIHARSPRDDGQRESPFLEKAGPDYVREAFRAARRATPRALLCLNEYGFEYDEPEQIRKRELFLKFARALREADAPIDVIGFQSHLDASKALDVRGVRGLLRELLALGFKFAVTELDVNDQKLPGDPETRDDLCARHADVYLDSLFAEARPISITTWGFTDSHSWLDNLYKRPDGRPLRPLAFDDQFGRKPLWRVIEKYLAPS